jgi:uncharacterized protein (DUF2141 family)
MYAGKKPPHIEGIKVWRFNVKKKIPVLFILSALCVFVGPVSLSAQTNTSAKASVEIRNVTTGGGTVHIDVFGEAAFRANTPDMEFRFEPAASIIKAELSLPAGEYVIAVYQDTNDNNELDSNLFGFPKEPFGMSNWNGGLPGSFDKRKVVIHGDSMEPVIIGLRK